MGGILGIFLAIAIGYPIGNVAYLLAGIVLVGGMIIFARLVANAHTPSQVYTGAALGLLVCFFAVYFSIY